MQVSRSLRLLHVQELLEEPAQLLLGIRTLEEELPQRRAGMLFKLKIINLPADKYNILLASLRF